MSREPEWEDADRDEVFDLLAYEAEVHELCGLHDSVAKQNPDMRMEPVACPMCADVERLTRVQRELDEAEDKKRYGDQRPPPGAELAADGRRGWRKWLLSPEEKAAESQVKPGTTRRGKLATSRRTDP